MINHITGQLVETHEESVIVERDGVGYVVMTPRYALGELAASHGREVTLHTLLFLDGGQNGGPIEPQLIGFPHADDKRFFRRFISVKGIGSKKALKALTVPAGQIADWIERGDVKALKGLPGIGSRAAELIVAELRGKLKELAMGEVSRGAIEATALTSSQRDALDIMVSLGDARAEAEVWLDRAVLIGEDADSAEEWIRAAYKVKTGVHAPAVK